MPIEPALGAEQEEQLEALVFLVPKPITAGLPGEYVTEGASHKVPKTATAPTNDPLQIIAWPPGCMVKLPENYFRRNTINFT